MPRARAPDGIHRAGSTKACELFADEVGYALMRRLQRPGTRSILSAFRARNERLTTGLHESRRSSRYTVVLTQPVLKPLFPAMAVSAVGDGMSAVGVAVLALHLAQPGTRGLVVGASVAAYTLPGAVGAAVLGRAVQGLSASSLIRADAVLRGVALGSIPVLFVLNLLNVPLYVILLGFSSLLHGWGVAGRYTLVAEELPASKSRIVANSLLSGMDQIAIIVGPVLAGVISTAGNASLPIAADALTFVALALATLSPTVRARRPYAGRQRPTTGHPFRIIMTKPALLGLLALTWMYFLLYGPVEVALPLYVTGPLGGSARLLGLFWALFGVGAVLGSVVAGWITSRLLWPVLIVSVLGWGAAILPLGLSRSATVSLVCFAAGGLLYSPYPALSYTVLQRESPLLLLSQVLAARNALTMTASPIGAALGGPLSQALGAQRAVTVSAVATIGLGVTALVVVLARQQAGKGVPQPGGEAMGGDAEV